MAQASRDNKTIRQSAREERRGEALLEIVLTRVRACECAQMSENALCEKTAEGLYSCIISS